MVRFLLRLFGLLFLAAGFTYLVYDGTKSVADSTVYVTTLGEAWAALHPNSFQWLAPAIEGVAAWLWNPIIVTVLEQPAWLVLGIIGAALIVLGRKRRPLIGYAR